MASLTLWLIVLNMFLLGGIFILSRVRRGRAQWSLTGDTSMAVAGPHVPSGRELKGLLASSERDLDALDRQVQSLERDVGAKVSSDALAADVQQLRTWFEQFAADVRSELNFLRSEIQNRSVVGDATWIQQVPVRQGRKIPKKSGK